MRDFEDRNHEFQWMIGRCFGILEIIALNFGEREENLRMTNMNIVTLKTVKRSAGLRY